MNDLTPDIFAVTETWLHALLPSNLVTLNGYHLVRLDRQPIDGVTKKGGGVAMYINELNSYSTDEYSIYNLSNQDIEILWISVKNIHQHKLVIGVTYRPPQGNPTNFCDIITGTVKDMNLDDNVDLFLVGDYNIDYSNNRAIGHSTCNLKDLERGTGLKQIIKSITRYGVKNSMIDLILTNSDYVAKSGTLNLSLSDHQATFVTRKKLKTKHIIVEKYGRSYVNYDRQKFEDELVAYDWTPLFQLKNPNEIWLFIKKVIEDKISKQCPIKKIKVKQSNEPWITQGLIELIHDKDHMLSRAKRTNDPDDWVNARLLRNITNKSIRKAKEHYIRDLLESHSGDPKKFWQQINKILPSSSSVRTINLIDTVKGVPIENSKTADYMNEYFASIGEKLNEGHDGIWFSNFEQVQTNIGLFEVSEESVCKLVKEIECCKSSAVDYLSTRILKHAFLVLPKQLTYCYNQSLKLGIFPESWKTAKVVPIFKSGDTSLVNNYRPISLLPLPGKLLEKLVHSHVSDYVEANNILDARQGGFRAGHSTIDTVACFTDDIYESVNVNHHTLAAFIDLRKAFDTVNHEILLKKLKMYGIVGNLLEWCKSYLKDREQCTIVNSVTSSYQSVGCGVPQGSILGPLMFLIFINDIGNDLHNTRVRLYADDTVLYTSSSNLAQSYTTLQNSLTSLHNWCSINRLTINSEKSKSMLLGRSRVIQDMKLTSLKLGGTPLEYVNTYKYLGITIDAQMTFQPLAKQVLKQTAHKVFLLSKVRRFLTSKAAISVYKTKILPYFDYGDIFYLSCPGALLEKLQRIQNRALRICLNSAPREPRIALHKKAGVPLLYHRRLTHVRNFGFKRARKSEYLDIATINTRRNVAPILKTWNVKYKLVEHSAYVKAAREWNSLTPEHRSIVNYDSFKRHKKKWLMNTIASWD